MVNQLNKALDDLVNYIKDSNEYKTCIKLKSQMSNNSEINDMVKEVKELQKKYIKSGYDKNVKMELDEVNNKLNEIPIYVIYNQNLEKVNEMINLVKDELNTYFDNLLNE